MQGDTPREGYDLLTQLRRLETRLARLQKRWQSFRADPRPDRLEQFRTAFSATDHALDELAVALGGSPGGAGSGGVGGAGASSGESGGGGRLAADARGRARAVVDAGRTLDTVLSEVSRAWGFLRSDPEPEGLAGLADRLARAEAAASLLQSALPGSTDDDGTPSREYADAEAGSLDALLTRIREDWHALRRDPAADRAGILRSELAEARRRAERVRSQLQSPGPGGAAARPDRETARYLTGVKESVRFGPYRDAFTGLYNREGFDVLAGAELKRCRRYSRSFGLLLLEVQPADLDELRGTIGTLQSLLRGYDLVSRYSDRLIAVGLPETNPADTRRIAARLLRALEGAGQRSLRRLSYALMPDDGATLSAMLEQAEQRLAS